MTVTTSAYPLGQNQVDLPGAPLLLRKRKILRRKLLDQMKQTWIKAKKFKEK